MSTEPNCKILDQYDLLGKILLDDFNLETVVGGAYGWETRGSKG